MRITTILKISILVMLFFLSSVTNAQTAYLTKLNDLEFGDVFMGYSKEISDIDIGAAKFSFYHTRWFRRNLKIDFTLPTVLTNGVDQIPIEFNQNHASWSYNDQIGGRTNFDPFSNYRIKSVWLYTVVYFWLGGRITTTTGLTPGTYTGNIIITINY